MKEKKILKICTSKKDQIEKKINQISESLLQLFYKIYFYNNKNVIVPIQENICLGCNISLPLQVQVNVRRAKDLSFCPSLLSNFIFRKICLIRTFTLL